MRVSLRTGLLVATAAVVAACGAEGPKQNEPKTPKTATPTTTDSTAELAQRPPHPNMASASWGEKVANHLVTQVPKEVLDRTDPATKLVGEALTALYSLEPGAEKRALPLAIAGWKRAPDDSTRGLALALASAALVLDPTVEGYGERLTDAFGLSIFAGTVDASDAVGQAARALVGAAGGNVRQARTLIHLVDTTPKLPDETRAFLALTRDAVRDHSDGFFDDAKKGLAARPDALRLRDTLATQLLELGLVDAAAAAVGTSDALPLALLKGRIALDKGDAAGAIAILDPLATKWAGVDEPRRAEALFWLGLARTSLATPTPADLTAVDEVIAALENRPGWKKESLLLRARRLQHEARDGVAAEAQALLMPLVNGTPTSTIAIERRIANELLTLCGKNHDSACVQKATRRLAQVDVDDAAVEHAAGLASADEAAAKAHEEEAERLAPGDATVRLQVLSVRRALASKASSLAVPVVDALVKNPELRVARALRVPLAKDPPEQARAAVAALAGAGPPLAESDLVVVIDGLGAWKNKDADAAFKALASDTRPRVVAAVERAKSDLAHPEQRKQRLAGDHAGDEDALPAAPVPAPTKVP